ncbi:hypothetical protein [Blastococcus sp. TF02A-26]|uniref:hypothetical protein n=1 Tax=Blastococcus sp. TF02A-26 TaxID=2250577 RepID=UPI000DE94430|nr:hypothetical protein [Blastococcus sp. TF02A-26]RBY82683.1 hypothetical protein DQ240_18490 [Blastococcus sp. TF02A-26]
MAYCGPRGIELDAFLRWSRRSQNAALEWAAHEALRCRGCGTHPEDWAENPHAHHAHLSDECPGCVKTHSAQQHFKELPPGQHVVLAPMPARDCPSCGPSRPTVQN